MLGSRAWTGTLDAGQLAAVRNTLGQNYLEAGASYGVDPQRLTAECIQPQCYRGLIELHAEQGLSLWNSKQSVAVVTGINGRRQFFVTVQGVPNHAGSTHMPQRRDALAGAAEMIVALEQLGNQLHQQLPASVITVGWITCEPNGLNIIPGAVRFSIDFRVSTDDMLESGETQLRELISQIAKGRELACQIERTEILPAMPLDAGVCQCIRNAAAKRGIPLAEAASGALHDAAIIAPFVPTAMIFVASRDGISHNPAEFSRLEDISVAAQLLADVVLS
jgi:hydantoinase/carbamoylase family amidase